MAPSARATRRVLPWVGLWALLTLLHATWSSAMPLMASPDEPSHVVRAAAVARGQWSGELGPPPQDGSRPGAGTLVMLPSDYAVLITLPNCIAFRPDEAADCQPEVPPATGGLVPVETFAGQYPPAYYAIVGWPSRFLGAEAAVYAMRLVSGAVAAALVTLGVVALRRALGRRGAAWAAAVALTPMTLFMGATVNPQALEISAGFAFWACLLALLLPDGRAPGWTVVATAVSGAALVSSRSTGPVWAVAALVVALVLARPGRWRTLLADRRVLAAVGVGGVAGVALVGWVVTHGGVVTGSGLFPEYANPVRTVAAITGHTYEYLLGMIGNFGWLDAPSPPVTTVVWFVAAGALLTVGVAARGPVRSRVALVLAALAVLGAPFALQLPTAADTGIIWQGRYVLPLAVGVPAVAVAVLAGQPRDVGDLLRRGARLLLPAVALAHVAAFLWAVRRYSEGMDGELLSLRPEWSSPIGYLGAVALYAVLVAVAAWPAWRALRAPVPRTGPDAQPEREPEPQPQPEPQTP